MSNDNNNWKSIWEHPDDQHPRQNPDQLSSIPETERKSNSNITGYIWAENDDTSEENITLTQDLKIIARGTSKLKQY